MGQFDGQVGFKAESVYGTNVVVNKFLPYLTQAIMPVFATPEILSMKPTQYAVGTDRFERFFSDAAGVVQFHPANKSSISSLLAPALGSEVTTGPTETTVYTHTGTYGDLTGKSLTVQTGVPDNAGTVTAHTFGGCKVGGLKFAMDFGGPLVCDLDITHAQSYTTATGLAVASFPVSAEYYFFSEATWTVDGTMLPVRKVMVDIKNVYAKREFINGQAGVQSEALQSAIPQISFSFDTEYNASGTILGKAQSLTAAGSLGALILVAKSKTILGTTIFPNITITIPFGRIDTPAGVSSPPIGGPQMLAVSGKALVGATGPITIAVQSADVTA